MEKKEIRRLRVVSGGDDVKGYKRHDLILIEMPLAWAHALPSLVEVSDEYQDAGLLVTNVGPDSLASGAGIARGDVLLRYNGVPLDNAETLTRLACDETRAEVEVEALRGTDEITFKLGGGSLGITVSALLYRSPALKRGSGRMIDSRENLDKVGFVEVRRELARKVLFLKALLEGRANSKNKKKAVALLNTAARMQAAQLS